MASPLKQHQQYPTKLSVDCRPFGNRGPKDGFLVCRRPQDVALSSERIGEGPSLAGVHNAHFSGGFVDASAHELIVTAYFGGSNNRHGAIFGVCLRTGRRRVISGEYMTPGGTTEQVGTGPAFFHALDVKPGPDGNWYVYSDPDAPSSHEIIRVNPTNGTRELVWKSRDTKFGQLTATDGKTLVQTHDTGFAVAEDGGFYVGVTNPQTGTGIVHISADAKTVTPVTMTSRDAKLARGTGPELRGFVQGYTLKDGRIYAAISKALLEIDPVTGNRTILLQGNASGSIGERWTLWDEVHKVWWTAGVLSTVTVVAFDPVSRKSFNAFKAGGPHFPWYPLCAGGPYVINSLNYGGIWKHPTEDRLLLAQDSISIIELELCSGNSVILSL